MQWHCAHRPAEPGDCCRLSPPQSGDWRDPQDEVRRQSLERDTAERHRALVLAALAPCSARLLRPHSSRLAAFVVLDPVPYSSPPRRPGGSPAAHQTGVLHAEHALRPTPRLESASGLVENRANLRALVQLRTSRAGAPLPPAPDSAGLRTLGNGGHQGIAAPAASPPGDRSSTRRSGVRLHPGGSPAPLPRVRPPPSVPMISTSASSRGTASAETCRPRLTTSRRRASTARAGPPAGPASGFRRGQATARLRVDPDADDAAATRDDVGDVRAHRVVDVVIVLVALLPSARLPSSASAAARCAAMRLRTVGVPQHRPRPR